tara:strand:- start:987 stop:2180 length:1194 start_codon:yes stop_codon:yes gene_type:complete
MIRNFQISKPWLLVLFIKINFFLAASHYTYPQKINIEAINNVNSYLDLLKDKNVGVVANNSSKFYNSSSKIHLIDSLLKLNVSVKKIFAPEHGFKGNQDAGEKIDNSINSKTSIPIISLYGTNRKPTNKDLENIDLILFDLQDVGVRFYTYLSTLHYVMESCAENNIDIVLLDRPNPNANYVDGPVLENDSKSFVGLHPVPILYGLTIGEYAKMINGEKWLNNKIQAKLTVIKMKNYNRRIEYQLQSKPSPNLPNLKSINLYPSLCFFEQTPVSIGRGTDMQFQVIGSPYWKNQPFSFIPKPNLGAKNPKHNGIKCFGLDLRDEKKLTQINLNWLIKAYNFSPNKEKFFRIGFHRLAGNKKLENQIKDGISAKKIKLSWKKDLEIYKIVREKYILYN